MERRVCERFSLPGATVDWFTARDSHLVDSYCSLRDLSRGGARFLTSRPAKEGTLVRVRIAVPGEAEPLELLGRVAWTLLSSGHTYSAAVEFAPFGPDPGSNDPAILDRLIALEARVLGPP